VSAPAVPRDFGVERRGTAELIVRLDCRDAFVDAGLAEPAAWRGLLAEATTGRGRGATARVALAPDLVVRVKQLRRGGALGDVRRETFFGRGRLLDNLSLPLESIRRGLATPAPVGLLVARAGPALYRGWLAVEEVADARDLGTLLSGNSAGAEPALEAAMRVVRAMHDRGIEHPDLNVGNLLLAPRASGGLEAWVIDLDRARVHPGPLAFARRQRALRRLERSFVKSRLPEPAEAEIRNGFYRRYAEGDAALAHRLERGRFTGRALIALHRLAW
jgi:hypothetical protein